MKMHYKVTTVSLISLIFSALFLSGCSSIMSSKMPKGGISMRRAYSNAIDGTDDTKNGDSINKVRGKVALLKQQTINYTGFTRTEQNEIDNQFPRLSDPNIVMYVYPHEAGNGNNLTPVPGYSTVFPLYQHVHYAMPGEVDTQ